jgi:hypothetical protein
MSNVSATYNKLGRDVDGEPMPGTRSPDAAIKRLMGVLNRAVAKERHEEASLAIEQLSRVHRNYRIPQTVRACWVRNTGRLEAGG